MLVIAVLTILIGCNDTRDITKNINMDEWYLATGKWYSSSPKLYVKEIGTGKDTVVMLHGGWGAEHSYLIDAVKGLKDKFHFVFYDQRGSLRSPSPDSLITLKNHVKDLELLRKELHVSKLKIAAHSMGTHLASAYLREYPENVKNLTLIGMVKPMKNIPYPDITTFKEYKIKFRENQRKRQTEILRENHVGSNRNNLSNIERTMQFKISFASVNLFYASKKWDKIKGGMVFYNQAAGNATIKSYYNAKDWDFTRTYKSNNVPISIINGSHDLPDCNPHLIKKWMNNIPNVDIKILENAGHNSWIDRPYQFREYFKNALSKQ